MSSFASDSRWQEQFLVTLIFAALFSIHLPQWGFPLFLAALVPVWMRRATIGVQQELRIVGLLFLLYVILFTVVSADPMRSVKGTYDIARGLLAFFPALWLGRVLGEAREVRGPLLLGTVVLLAHFAFPGRYLNGPFYGFYENPNNVAVTVVAYLFLLGTLFPNTNRGGMTHILSMLLFSVATVLGLVLVVLANSRGAWLGLAVAASVLVLIQRISCPLRAMLISVVAASLLLLLAGVDLKGFYAGSLGHETARLRLLIWQSLTDSTLQHHPLVGCGINCTKDLLTAAGIDEVSTAHNVILEIFVSSGVIGLAAVGYISWRLYRFLRQQRYRPGPVLHAGIGGLVAFLVMGQLDLKFASYKFIATVACFVGLIYSQAVVERAPMITGPTK